MNDLNENNFLLYAARSYRCISFNDKDFIEDIKRIKYIKRLFNRYIKTGNLKERLILNHIVILYNVFKIEELHKLLFFKLEGYYSILKPFLVALHYCPKFVEFNGQRINVDMIFMDENVISKLRVILNAT